MCETKEWPRRVNGDQCGGSVLCLIVFQEFISTLVKQKVKSNDVPSRHAGAKGERRNSAYSFLTTTL
jgi:hypothetical protein